MRRQQNKGKRPQCTRKVTKKEAFNKRFSISVKPLLLTLLLVAPLALIIATYQWIQNPENLTIKSVEVTGDFTILDKKQLEPIIESYAKTNLFLLDVKNLEKDIESNPWVHSAALTHVWPNKLIVKIYEQKPVAHWGKFQMLAENGEIIKASMEKQKGELPMLYSPNDKGRNMATGFMKIRKMMKGFPVKLVEFKEDARGSWRIKLENGMTLKIGREHQAKRLKRFMVAYEHSLNEVLDKISVVDLRYTNGFAVKWKKGLSADSVFKG
ncbi:MAG: cell division protein FtsQ/DivIB [Cocleimonas sp.]